MAKPKVITRPYILEVDIAGEILVLGITHIKDALSVFNILGDNGYHVTLEVVKTSTKEKPDEEVPVVR